MSGAMTGVLVVALIGTAIIVWIGARPYAREWRRARIKRRAFSSESRRVLEERVPIYRRVPAALKDQLHGNIQVLLQEKEFIGAAGLVITEEMKLTIACQAALLLFNRRTDYFNGLMTVLVYPSRFLVNKEVHEADGVLTKHQQVLSGESWDLGRVIVSWDDVEEGTDHAEDGYNVVLHEFAHQLDQEDGTSNGAPVLESAQAYENWSRVFSHEYALLQERAELGEATVIDPYGAEDPAEFFAVATETFFERPDDLHREHPDLYRELRNYYKVNPIEWR